MTCQQVLETARTCSGHYCKVCPVCNGRACKNGPGSKGSGTVAARNCDVWQNLCLNMDTICEGGRWIPALPCLDSSTTCPFLPALLAR